jgi:hypothetical protein
MALRRQKSKKQQAASKFKSAGKSAKGTALQVREKTSWKSRIPLIAGVGLAALAIVKLSHRGGDAATA